MKRHRIVKNKNEKYEYLFRKYGKPIQIHNMTKCTLKHRQKTHVKMKMQRKEEVGAKNLSIFILRMRRTGEMKKLSTKYMIYDK